MHRSASSLILAINLLHQLSTTSSQCPEYFRYYRNETTKNIMGLVEIPHPPQGVPLHLRIELSIAAILPPNHSGKLELAKPKDDSIRSLLQGLPIFYKIYFPLPKPQPVVTGILLNDVQYCSGPPATGIVVTTIRLLHSLYPPRVVIPLTEQLFDYISNRTRASSAHLIDHHTTKSPPILTTHTDLDENPITTTTTTTTPKSSKKPTTISTTLKPISEYQLAHPSKPKPIDLSCGLVSNNDSDHPWPWLAAIFFLDDNDQLEFLGTGNLISRQHVITVAHCLIDDDRDIQPSRLIISLGQSNNGIESFNISVADIKFHPDYVNPASADSDLAIIKLKERIDFTPDIRSICLWLGKVKLDSVVGDPDSFVVGYEHEDKPKFTLRPRSSKVAIVSQENCLRKNAAFLEVTSNRTFCAEYRDENGFCSGASGSGLVMAYKPNGRYHLRGMLSLSMLDVHTRLCDLNEYVVFVDVAKYLGWIKQEITV